MSFSYDFVIVRFTPNLAREEFVNIGILMCQHNTGEIRYKMFTPLSPNLPPIPGMTLEEIHSLFAGLNALYDHVIENLEDLFMDWYDCLPVDLGTVSAAQRFFKRQDAHMGWSELKTGIHPTDPFERLNPLFQELVEPVPILVTPSMIYVPNHKKTT